MLRVAVSPLDLEGCGSTRIHHPARAVEAAGLADVEIFEPGIVPANRLARDASVDVVVIQRPTRAVALEKIQMLQAHGIAVVVDVDDDLAAAHSSSPTFRMLHPTRSPDENWHHLKSACRLADMVTVTTPALASRYGGENAVVVPNCVPASLLEVTADRDGRTVGWAGNTFTHINDLAATNGGVAQALEDTGARFLLVGADPDDARRQLGLANEALDTTGYLDLDEYPPAVARFDVGIVPLADSQFNRAKSGLKGLEYAALGVPFVASATPEYEYLHHQGVGLLARRGRSWRGHIRQLLEDTAQRAELADRARQVVAERHTFETQAWRWTEAWSAAIGRRRHVGRRRIAA